MEIMDVFNKRFSLRKYSTKPVDREIINRCLEAARLAPSACNSQPWSFIVVDDPEIKNKLVLGAFSGIHNINKFTNDAPVLIVAILEHANLAAKLGGWFKGINYSLMDLGIACEHLVLQATHEGLGSCYLGWFNAKAVKKILNIPWNKDIKLLISLGYPKEDKPRTKQRKKFEEIIKYNTY